MSGRAEAGGEEGKRGRGDVEEDAEGGADAGGLGGLALEAEGAEDVEELDGGPHDVVPVLGAEAELDGVEDEAEHVLGQGDDGLREELAHEEEELEVGAREAGEGQEGLPHQRTHHLQAPQRHLRRTVQVGFLAWASLTSLSTSTKTRRGKRRANCPGQRRKR